MRSLTRLTTAGVLGAAALALLTGCLGSSDSGSGDQDANRNSEAKKVELTIGSNSVKGGKSSAGATFLEDVLIPKFVADAEGQGRRRHGHVQGARRRRRAVTRRSCPRPEDQGAVRT